MCPTSAVPGVRLTGACKDPALDRVSEFCYSRHIETQRSLNDLTAKGAQNGQVR
jgi:hypothetical protein